MSALFEEIEELVRAINETPDDRFAEAVGARLDLPLFMRYLAVEDFLSETDGLVGEWGLHNFYLYRPQRDERARLIPWDKDTGFSAVDHPLDYHLLDNVLTRRAIAISELRQIYVETLIACATLASAREPESLDPRGWLEREVDRAAGSIRAAVGDDPVYPFSLEQFDESIEWLRDFARRRPAIVECALGANPAGTPSACAPGATDAREK